MGGFGMIINQLFNNRLLIERNVQTVYNGVITTTTSEAETVIDLIQTHVQQMANLNGPIRQGDPLFASLFRNIQQTVLDVEYIENGVRVSNTGTTDCGVALVQAHAAQVSRFVQTGDRRPDFDWVEPESCANPQPITTTAIEPTPTTTTASTGTLWNGSSSVTSSTRGAGPTSVNANPTSATMVPPTSTEAATTERNDDNEEEEANDSEKSLSSLESGENVPSASMSSSNAAILLVSASTIGFFVWAF